MGLGLPLPTRLQESQHTDVAGALDERKAVVIISVLNILSAAYILLLYFLFGSGAAGFVLVLAGVAASLYALKKMTDEAVWKMYKTSSPILALFLIALMLH